MSVLLTSGDLGRLSAVHSWFPYPAKFPPDAVAPIISRYSMPDETVLDPFCGSGTVLVEASRLGRHSIGIELNPVAAAVARAKSKSYTQHDLARLKAIIASGARLTGNAYQTAVSALDRSDVPRYRNVELWFKKSMLRELAAIRKMFVLPYQSHKIGDLLWTAFFRAVIPASNQDNDTRYTAVEKPWLKRGYALGLFLEYLERFADDMRAMESLRESVVDSVVQVGDSVSVLSQMQDGAVDLVVTSPPYINTYDYYLYHKHRLFWYGHDPRSIRKAEMGNHHRIDSMAFEEAVAEYQDYIVNLLKQLRRVVRPGGNIVFLIGDGIVKQRLVRGDECLRHAAISVGLRVEDVNSMSLRSVSKRFIKTSRIDSKRHHIVTINRPYEPK